jgi:hypothetical protein
MEERLVGWHTRSLSSRVGTFGFVKNQIIVIVGVVSPVHFLNYQEVHLDLVNCVMMEAKVGGQNM